MVARASGVLNRHSSEGNDSTDMHQYTEECFGEKGIPTNIVKFLQDKKKYRKR